MPFAIENRSRRGGGPSVTKIKLSRFDDISRLPSAVNPTQHTFPHLQRPAARFFLERRVVMEPCDGLFERLSADEPHGVVWAAVEVSPQSTERHNPGMLKAAALGESYP